MSTSTHPQQSNQDDLSNFRDSTKKLQEEFNTETHKNRTREVSAEAPQPSTPRHQNLDEEEEEEKEEPTPSTLQKKEPANDFPPPISTTAIRGKHHLRIYAVPCDTTGNQIYFFPQFVKGEPKRLEKFHDKISGKYRRAEPKTFKGKIWARHERRVAKEPPSEKMVKRLPRHVSSIEIIYPSDMKIDELLKQMRKQVQKESSVKKKDTIGFGLALPVCVLIDIFTIGFLLTLGDLILLMSSYRSWKGTKDVLNTLKKKDEMMWLTRSNFLQEFREKSKGKLTENDYHDLREYCHDGDVAKTVMKLRELDYSKVKE